MQGLKDPEAKRKAIGAGFIEVFNDFAKGFERKPRFLVQVLTPPLPHMTIALSHSTVAMMLDVCAALHLGWSALESLRRYHWYYAVSQQGHECF